MGIMGLGPLEEEGGSIVGASLGALDLTRILCQPSPRIPMDRAVSHQVIRARGIPLDP